MRYLLDTNVVSELRRRKPHGAVVQWLAEKADSDIFISAVTLGEIQAGVEITRTQDHEKAEEIEHWLERVSEAYNVLDMTGPIFRLWAKLMHKQSDALIEDAMIAATALGHGMTVATRNEKDFLRLQVNCVNPFTD